MSEKLIILLLSGTLLMTGVMALSWEPGRDRTLTLVRQRLRRMQRNRE